MGWLLLGLNAVCFAAYGWDKLCAVRGRKRVPETRLLGFSLPLTAAGAWTGVLIFRHKTRKTGFLVKLGLLTLLQVAAVAAYLVYR